MSAPERPRGGQPAPTPAGAAKAPTALSRRRLLGGALAGALATAILGGERLPAPPGPSRWKGKTRWIGHC